MALSSLLLAYIVGGVTFIPLLAIILGAFAYVAFTKPISSTDAATTGHDADPQSKSKLDDAVHQKSKTQYEEPEIAAAYFAVCREYVPGGINGKPPERSTPAGEVLIAESPSVYQSMYRSIFERGKTQIPSVEGDKRDGKAVKKARNVFFVVLRHGHLMLYDDSEQVEVRHVVSLAHHDVDVYAGGDALPEGELWIKRNCIRLMRKSSGGGVLPSSKPFYFFSDNCSEKEDFYHALLLAQASILGDEAPPLPQKFDTSDAIKLVQNLHASDADSHSRWLNAIIGRIFLAMYKTPDIENFIRAKINKKISRVPKPNFITSIDIKEIDMGNSAPVISNPRLKEMTVNGDMTIEVDIKYNGGFKLQMGAVARIDLGTRFKAREVTLVMAGILKKLSGHLLIHIKPPPSNRMWMTFESMPHIEMSIEPVVSSRQITYGVILRAIESRIREVIGETIVLPNWDDSPFLDTQKKEYRGGIFQPLAKEQASEEKEEAEDGADIGMVETAMHELVNSAGDGESDEGVIHTLADTGAKTVSMPSLFEPVSKLSLRKTARRSVTSLAEDSMGTSTGSSPATTPMQTPKSPPLRPRSPSSKPRPLRSNSFAAAATPLVTTEGSNIEAVRPQTRKKGQKEAVDLVKEVRSRTQSTTSSAKSPKVVLSEPEGILPSDGDDLTPLATQEDETTTRLTPESPFQSSVVRRSSEPVDQLMSKQAVDMEEPSDPSLLPSATIPLTAPRSPSLRSVDSSATASSHISTAANAAKKWGWQVLNRQNPSSSTGNTFGFGKRGSTSSVSSGSSVSLPPQPPNPNALKAALLAQPMGRGQPLPPPGTPLPGPPQKSLWSASNLNLGSLKRKPVATQQSEKQPTNQAEDQKATGYTRERPPPLPARPSPVDTKGKTESSPSRSEQQSSQDPDVFVVAAPVEDDSSPGTPNVELMDRGIPTHAVKAPQETATVGSILAQESDVEGSHTGTDELATNTTRLEEIPVGSTSVVEPDQVAGTRQEESKQRSETEQEEANTIQGGQEAQVDGDKDTVVHSTKARPFNVEMESEDESPP